MSITKKQGVGGKSRLRRLSQLGEHVINNDKNLSDRNSRRIMKRLREKYGDEAIDQGLDYLSQQKRKSMTDEPPVFKIKDAEPIQFQETAIIQPKPVASPWGRVSEVAAKLGVLPCEPKKQGTITALGRDGNTYDLWEIIVAFLDRMNAKAG